MFSTSALLVAQFAISPNLGTPGPLWYQSYASLDEAEPVWRALETVGVCTPYQRYDWIAGLVQSGIAGGDQLSITVAFSGERPIALLPLEIASEGGLRQGRIIGSAWGNSDFLLVDPAAPPLSRSQLMAMFETARAALGRLDVIGFANMPVQWQATRNPLLVFEQEPAPSNLYGTVIGPTPAPYIDHRISSKRRANLRRGMRRLEELFGPIALRRADTPQAIAQTHAAFLAQRGARFEQMGIVNIFAEPGFQRFFHDLALQQAGKPRPALSFHALYAGNTIVATAVGAYCGDHYAQYINSHASGEAAKYSLTGVMMAELCDQLNAQGILTLDLGIGDFDYKTEWTTPETVFNSAISLSALGRMMVPLLRWSVTAKRTIKQNRNLWQFARRLQKARYALLRHLAPKR